MKISQIYHFVAEAINAISGLELSYVATHKKMIKEAGFAQLEVNVIQIMVQPRYVREDFMALQLVPRPV